MVIWSNVQRFGVNVSLMLLKVVSYVHQGCMYLIENTVKTVMLWQIIIS